MTSVIADTDTSNMATQRLGKPSAATVETRQIMAKMTTIATAGREV
jgi:hypothetical protein